MLPSLAFRIYKTYVESILLYGCETWGMNKTITNEVNRFKRRLIRRVLGVKWPKVLKNEEVDSYDEPAINVIQRRRWQMLGHVLRMNDNIPAKQETLKCLNSILQTKRKRGRPPTTLTNTLISDLRKHKIDSMEQATELANDRQLWRETFKQQEDVALPRPRRSNRLGTSQ